MVNHRRGRRRNQSVPSTEKLPPLRDIHVIPSNTPAVIRRPEQTKYYDAGPLVINCSIKEARFLNCLCDTGASMSVMPLMIAKRLGLHGLQTRLGKMKLIDQTNRRISLLEDIPVIVDDVLIPTDFAVLDTGNEPNQNLIFGRPFLQSTNATIDMFTGIIRLKFNSYHQPCFARNGTMFNLPPARYLEGTSTTQVGGSSSTDDHDVFTISFPVTPGREPRRIELPTPSFARRSEDEGPITIICTIGKVTFHRALCDTGASINIMPLTLAKRLGLTNIKPDSIRIRMANQSVTESCGILEHIPVRVEGIVIPTTFTVLNMSKEPEYGILFGRTFLADTHAEIHMLTGAITLDLRPFDKYVFTRDGSVFRIPRELDYSPSDWAPNASKDNELIWDPEIERSPSPPTLPR